MREPSIFQKKAIEHLSGPAQVIAGPGSGKTFTIIERILYLIKNQGISPQNILVITYTKAAALEMQERYQKENAANAVLFGTFHSICYQILIQSGHFSNQSIISETQKQKLLKVVLQNQGMLEKDGYDYLCEIINFFSKKKNGINVSEEQEVGSTCNFTNQELISIKKEYDNMTEQNGWLDFDDIICNCQKLLEKHPAICQKYQTLYQYILVDEFQDINAPQYEILKLLAGVKQNLFVVGDDDQAIYGFRGATPGIMQKFCKDYPNAKQIFLTENYRSGNKIVQMSDQVISQNTSRFSKQFLPIREGGRIEIKELQSRKEEYEAILDEMKRDQSVSYDDSAIILRTNIEAIQYFELLKENGIPVREKCSKDDNVFQSFLVEDIKAFLSFIYNGNKRSDFLAFMNKPNRYLSRMALPYETVSKESVIQYYHLNNEMLQKTEQLFHNLNTASKLTPQLSITLFRNAMGYNHYLKEKAENIVQERKWNNQLEQIQKNIAECKQNKEVVDYIHRKQKEQENMNQPTFFSKGIHVITMHGAKGLEFNKVYLPDINEGIIPGKKCITKEEIEEERRLLYVAITRAKDSLFITYTRERNKKISRYLEKITLPHPLQVHQIPHYQAIRQTHQLQCHIPRHPQSNPDGVQH